MWLGWLEPGSKYCTLSVGFLYKSVSILLLMIVIFMCRKVVDLSCMLYSQVNFIVGCRITQTCQNGLNQSCYNGTRNGRKGDIEVNYC